MAEHLAIPGANRSLSGKGRTRQPSQDGVPGEAFPPSLGSAIGRRLTLLGAASAVAVSGCFGFTDAPSPSSAVGGPAEFTQVSERAEQQWNSIVVAFDLAPAEASTTRADCQGSRRLVGDSVTETPDLDTADRLYRALRRHVLFEVADTKIRFGGQIDSHPWTTIDVVGGEFVVGGYELVIVLRPEVPSVRFGVRTGCYTTR